jgi:glyceraldehyde 3-phosphate dehydrogenase
VLRVGINGFGRIGRAIYRANLEKQAFKIVAVNDINPDLGNIAYTVNYDSLYDRLKKPLQTDAAASVLYNDTESIAVYHKSRIADVPWEAVGVDILIDASGILANVLNSRRVTARGGVRKVIITHLPERGVDFSMVLGANEHLLDVEKHDVISSSICDATAIAPVLKLIKQHFGLRCGYVTTLHPWLSYQNLMDGPASSWSVPGEIYHHYALGRSTIGNLIPKPTTAIQATCRVLEGVTEAMIGSFSYRTPTAIVGSADVTLVTEQQVERRDVCAVFEEYEKQQRWQILHNNVEPLVSLDFKRSEFSAVVDRRWTNVVGDGMVKLVLWYDNEWGYASRVVDQVSYVASRMEEAEAARQVPAEAVVTKVVADFNSKNGPRPVTPALESKQ